MGLQPVYRGGNWNNGSNAGSFYLNGNNDFSNWNYNIGARLGYLTGKLNNIKLPRPSSPRAEIAGRAGLVGKPKTPQGQKNP